MSEIEKLYENAGLFYCNKCRHDSELDCIYMCESKYPPFTAEKQLELIIFIINKFGTLTFFDYEKFTREVMAEKIAKLLNNHWQNLSDILKQQVKNILEE